MAKIKVNADTVLSILQGIMNDEDINYKISDTTSDWLNKTVTQALNVEYYTFKHRPVDTELLVRGLINQGEQAHALMSLERSFCILSLNSVDRVFSKDNDIVTISANLEYWIQTSKIKLLEDLIEDMAIATNGIRIPIQISGEMRKAILAFSNLNVLEIQDATEFGEMAVCDLSVDMVFYPNVVSRSEYAVEVLVQATEFDEEQWVKLPFSGLSISSSMTQKSVPSVNNVREVGSINLSRVKTFVLTFDGYVNKVIDKIVCKTLTSDMETDNNESLVLKITRGEEVYYHDCIIKDHLITIQEDTGNEVHSITLTTKGV